ncbi:MAG: hypothetical protein ACJAZF_002850, partial [Granulosicoccus sp.]
GAQKYERTNCSQNVLNHPATANGNFRGCVFWENSRIPLNNK